MSSTYGREKQDWLATKHPALDEGGGNTTLAYRFAFDIIFMARSLLLFSQHCCTPQVSTSRVVCDMNGNIAQYNDKPAGSRCSMPIPLAITVPGYHSIKITIRLEDTEEEYGTDVAEG